MRPGANITVGYDGSRSARRALDWAATQAAAVDGCVRVVASVRPATAPLEPWYVPAPVDATNERERAARSIDEAAAECARAHPGARFEEYVMLGSPCDNLVDAAAGSDLLVVGSRGHGPMDALRLGSVAHAVVRHARRPVVVVPDRDPDSQRGRIVVGVDESPAAAAAVRWACDEADDRDAELLVVHGWSYAYATEIGASTARDLTAVDAALVLEAATREARERRRGPVLERLIEDRPATALIDAARDADLVVVGSRGRGTVRWLLFGSVSHEVSAHATCPTVIVRDDSADTERPT